MKKKISLLPAIIMLLSGCNTAEKAEQATSEITTTTTAETIVVTTPPTTTTTTTTTTIATTTEKQTSSPTKETEITQATEDTPMTPKSEVYLFDYHSFDEIAPSEEEQFEIFENVFYGEWKNDTSEISFTYQDCYFSFTNSCYPTRFMEIDDGYVLWYVGGGMRSCFFVNKADTSVMYQINDYAHFMDDIIIDENTAKYHKKSYSYSKEISEGKLSSLGQMKLNSIVGGNFEECLNGTLDEKPIFTDIDGTEWVYGLGTLGTPDQERYLVSYSEDKVELGIRHFKKSEYDAYMDMELDVEPEEQYFVLVFEKTDGVWQYKNTYEPVEEVYFADCKETFEINTITRSNYNVVFFETEYDETYNSKDNPEMFDENGMFKKERNYKSVYKKANKGDKFGNLTLIKTETHLGPLVAIEDSGIRTGVPGWSVAEFEGEVTLDGVLFYADENDPVWRGYMFVPFSSSLKENNLPMLHYYTNGWGYSSNNGYVKTSGRTTHFSLHHSETNAEKMKKILNGNDSTKVRATLSDIYMYWTYDNGSGYDPYIAKLESIIPIT